MVSYRKEGLAGERLTQVRMDAFYIVLGTPPATRGQLFISHKDPEDGALARMLCRLCERAGFAPYIAPSDARPGNSIWKEKIPVSIRKSRAVLAVWSSVTPVGTGVQREIRLARKLKIKDVPLIERGTAIPREYANMKIEITWFERRSAPSDFSRAIMALRSSLK